MIDWWKTIIGESEIQSVANAIRGGHLSQGPVTEAFERQLADTLGVAHVVTVPSGSAALLLSLMACGVRPGDEVIVPTRTFMATANAALVLGATVRLVDVEAGRPVIDPDRIEAAINDRTRAILPVHLNGRAANMPRILALARKHGLRVIEDAAQAFCSRAPDGTALGTIGDLGAFSLGVTKLITTGQGGFVTTRDETLAEQLRKLRNHGSITPLPGRYDEFGFNFKYTDIQAAMGLCQADRLTDKIDRHKAVYRHYCDGVKGLKGVEILPVDLARGEIPLWIEVLCMDRDAVVAHLRQRGIAARPFLPNLSDAAYLRTEGDFRNGRRFADHGLTLPCGPDQPEDNIARTVDALHEMEKRG